MPTSSTTAIITSAAYVNSEIAAEFGQLPPAFLPMGHKRLFSWQIESLRAVSSRIVLTLPESYHISTWDLSDLRGSNVEIIRVPDGLSIGESLSQALILANALDRAIILHGDTLFLNPIPTGTDWVSTAASRGSYAWGAIDATGKFVPSRPLGGEVGPSGGEAVLTGLFALSSGLKLLRCLTSSRGDFLQGLNHYTRTSPLQFQHLDQWLDFGHLQTFYRSRAAANTARSFNTLSVAENSVLKSGSKVGKIRGEAAWFDSLPAPLRLFCPPFLGEEKTEDGFSG